MIPRDEIRRLEERAFNGWPAEHTLAVGGWLIRVSSGYTKRANSVSALAPFTPFEEVQAAAEALFDRHSLPPIFRLTPLATPDVDRRLDADKYERIDPNVVLTSRINEISRQTGVRIDHHTHHEWADLLASAAALSTEHRKRHGLLVGAIKLPAAFATLRQQGKAIGFGLGVLERGMVGIFDVMVVPERRAQGYGRAITQALLSWAHRSGAREAYLQVGEHNVPARQLYSSFGFQEAYRYHYRRRIAV